MKRGARVAAGGADHVAGKDLSAELLHHYLDNKGEGKDVDVERLLAMSLTFQKFATDLRAELRSEIRGRAHRSLRAGRSGPLKFGGEWEDARARHQNYIKGVIGAESDLFLSLKDFSASYTASGTIKNAKGEAPTVDVNYQLHIYDYYDYGSGSGFAIAATQLRRLHEVGKAQEFHVGGSGPIQGTTVPLVGWPP